MSVKHFLDTNIIIYSFESTEKGERAKALVKEALTIGTGHISYQVVQELINVSSKKFKVPMKTEDIKKYLRHVLYPLLSVYSSQDLYLSALDISERWQYSFYDSLIIASALSIDCEILYSEDLQHGQKVFGLQIINPFID